MVTPGTLILPLGPLLGCPVYNQLRATHSIDRAAQFEHLLRWLSSRLPQPMFSVLATSDRSGSEVAPVVGKAELCTLSNLRRFGAA
jgi:hypothetical protein